jgi:hypothetical protein
VIVLLVLWWNPTPGTSRLLPTLVLIALLVAGLEALRHLTLREFPDAERGELSAALRGAFGSRRRASAPAAEDERLQSLEKLAELQAAGVLTEAEVASEKQRILGAA